MSKKPSPRKPAENKATTKAKAVKSVKKAPAPKPVEARGPVKTSLNKADLDMFRKMLLDKRRSIIGDMNGIEAEALGTNRQEGSGDLSNMPTHPADIGTDNYEQEFSLGLLASERTLLKEIDQALDRIRSGTFGVCMGTGQPIGKARLQARPWAKFCIDYARQVEKGLARGPERAASASDKDEESEGAEHEADMDADSEIEAPEDVEVEVEEETEE